MKTTEMPFVGESPLILGLLGTTQQTRSARSNKTSLLTLCGVPRDGRSLTDMLMVTTTVRMVDGVHGNTTSLRPAVTLDGELMLGTRSLQERLVGTATTGDDTNHTTRAAGDNLLGTGGELDAGLALIGVVADNGDVVAGGTAQGAAVTDLLLDVGDDGTFGHGAQRQNVTDGQSGVLAGVDELAGVHALVGDEGLGDLLELVGAAEGNLGEGSTSAGVVDDLLDDTANVAMTLGEVERSELGRGLAQVGVGGEDASLALSLVTNHATHLDGLLGVIRSRDGVGGDELQS
jgi:hypothetical protein